MTHSVVLMDWVGSGLVGRGVGTCCVLVGVAVVGAWFFCGQ